MKKEKKKLTQVELDRQRKRSKIIKTVAVSVGWSFLAFCFVGLLALQVQSCNKKKRNESNVTTPVNVNNGKRYVMNYHDKEYIFYDNKNPFTYSYLSNFSTGSFETLTDGIYNVESGSFCTTGGTLSRMHNALFGYIYTLTLTLDGSTVYSIQCGENGSNIRVTNDLQGLYYTTSIDTYTDLNDATQYGDYDDLYTLYGLCLGVNSYAVGEGQGVGFSFLNTINRYAPLGGTNDNAIFLGDEYLNGNEYIKATVFTGLFTDLNGVWYREILVHYSDANGLRYLDNSGSPVVFDLEGMCYLGLYFVTLDGSQVYVNRPIYVTVDNNVCYTNQSSWYNSFYKDITIYAFGETVNTYNLAGLSGKTGEQVLNSFNNNNGTGTGTGGGSIGGNASDVFSLLALAFASISSILSMQIVGGVTLGTLIFIPFVITIIIFVVWLFKR